MLLEKVRKAIDARASKGEALENDAEILRRIESGYFEESKEAVVMNLENPICNAKGDVVLEKLWVKKRILGRDALRISQADALAMVGLLLGIDRSVLRFVPAFLTEVVLTYFGEGLVRKERPIKEKDGQYVYTLEEPVRFEDETLKELRVLTTAELSTEHLSLMLMNEGRGIFGVMSQIFSVRAELLEAMTFSDLDGASRILDRLKKKRW